MSNAERDSQGLGPRARGAFEAIFSGKGHALHPQDRMEAERFWEWLGGMERPSLDVDTGPADPWWRSPAFAAGIAACLLLAFASFAWWESRRPQQPLYESFASARAERRAIQLVDGSVVTLAADSKVDVRYTPGERRLRLVRGEALFDVAHNPARPFIVEVAHGEIKAVGTAFDVKVRKDDADVTVVDGVVRISMAAVAAGARNDALVQNARKGERVRFGVTARKGERIGVMSQIMNADVDEATAWTRGLLVFRGEPLDEVIATVNRYSRDTVVLSDASKAKLPVYGVLNQGDTAALRDLIQNPETVEIQSRR